MTYRISQRLRLKKLCKLQTYVSQTGLVFVEGIVYLHVYSAIILLSVIVYYRIVEISTLEAWCLVLLSICQCHFEKYVLVFLYLSKNNVFTSNKHVSVYSQRLLVLNMTKYYENRMSG